MKITSRLIEKVKQSISKDKQKDNSVLTFEQLMKIYSDCKVHGKPGSYRVIF